MRGLWVSFITLDMTDTDKTFESFKAKFNKIVMTAKEYKLNTLIVQVRPFCDALYKSSIFPYSHILTGTQGKDPGYDALEYMCEHAHLNGLKLHAWINPYRVSTASSPEKLAKNNPYNQNKDIALELESGIILNPAKKATRKLIVDGVKEIIENYDIDGIQFDDYFYPTDTGNEDIADYNNYKKALSTNSAIQSHTEWRFWNVNTMIAEVYATVKAADKNIVFGISPQGNIENNKALYADITTWCKTYGYADYICPQMYYSTENPSLSFEDSLIEWNNLNYHSDISVYIGLGAYKAGSDADNGTWLDNSNILATELQLLRKYKYDGFMIYDYSAFENEKASDELKNLLSAIG